MRQVRDGRGRVQRSYAQLGGAVIWIGYTTLYRGGGPSFARAATAMAEQKRSLGHDVRLERVESKKDFVEAMSRIGRQSAWLTELHFIGHSGMYGPMFRTAEMPEQFSPNEWVTLAQQRHIPFASLRDPTSRASGAYFHACRTARWFAPFFARTFDVVTYGYRGYTTFSTRRDAFRWENPWAPRDAPLYVVACPGRKSHGLLGSILKYGSLAKVEALQEFIPAPVVGDATYDSVADLYDEVFADIGVRADECRWLDAHLPDGPRPRVLDVGCGNGALLRRLSPRISSGVGVDRSTRLLSHARNRSRALGRLSFVSVQGPKLPFPDESFDVIISLLSFRYLDWDPIMAEMRRVLAPGGRILIIDMVTVPLSFREVPLYARTKVGQWTRALLRPDFARSLRRMVRDPRWGSMLAQNPIRAEHELKWYLESRFPGRMTELLNTGWTARVLAFDSGPLPKGWSPPQSYP